MTQRRSKRTSAITKRRLLEETLNKRRSAAEKRKLIIQSRKELDCFNQEAQDLTNLVQRLLNSDTESEESVDTLERTVNEIIEEINTLGNKIKVRRKQIEEEKPLLTTIFWMSQLGKI